MAAQTSSPRDQIANASDFPPVCVYFEDETITQLFSDLLEARGIHTQILTDLEQMPNGSETKIITEPQFFQFLDKSSHGKCLIVGNKEALRGIAALSLSRPLTEEKIENALAQFLRT